MRFGLRRSKPKVRHAALTDTGLRREHNEDAVAVLAPKPDDGWGYDLAAVVCDGVGGFARGEMASRIAIEEFSRALSRPDPSPPGERLQAAASAASAAIRNFALRELEGAPIATTVVVAVLHDGRATVGHVGDSRAYLFRRGELRALTADHSIVAEQVRAGLLLPQEARSHPLRNRLSRALGHGTNVRLDLTELATEPHDLFLLCSDGLHAFVEEADIARAISDDLEGSTRRLIEFANAQGGIDNITVALCRVE